MAAIGFDTLKCARRLKSAGFTREQAETQAEVMAEAYFSNLDALVTKDYLDARLAEVDVKFRLVFWGQGLTLAVLVIPALRDFFLP